MLEALLGLIAGAVAVLILFFRPSNQNKENEKVLDYVKKLDDKKVENDNVLKKEEELRDSLDSKLKEQQNDKKSLQDIVDALNKRK